MVLFYCLCCPAPIKKEKKIIHQQHKHSNISFVVAFLLLGDYPLEKGFAPSSVSDRKDPSLEADSWFQVPPSPLPS